MLRPAEHPRKQTEVQQAERPKQREDHPVVAGQHESNDAQDENHDTNPGRHSDRKV
jgi:hypothetical protein